MAYKKYIRRNGKLYGPYIYHSKRVGGKVISEYQGMTRKIDYRKLIVVFFGVLFAVGIFYGVISNKSKPTGNVIVDLEEENLLSITDLIVTQLHEENESIQRYDLNLGVSYESNLSLNYDWRINCGYFVKDNENLGTEYSGSDNLIEWRTEEECVDAVVRVDVLVEDNGQELEQPVFNPEDRMIINIRDVLSSENVTETDVSEKEIGDEEVAPLGVFQTAEYGGKEIVEMEIVRLYFLTEDEKQILVDEFGEVGVRSNVGLFKDRIIVKYELGNMWIENSYDADLGDEELERQMEIDRVKWLKDIINGILSEESVEQYLSEENYPILS